MKTEIKHNVDPLRYPKIQRRYEKKSKDSLNTVKIFGDVVQTMVDIVKNRKQ